MKFININKIISRFLIGRASLGTSTMLFQLAMLLFLFVLKLKMSDAVFSSFLVSLGIASIIGAVASMRSEILITQSMRDVNIKILLWPLLIALFAITLLWLAHPIVTILFSTDITIYTLLFAFGFSLQAICQFILIQEAGFSKLLFLKASQSVILVITALLLLFDFPYSWAVWGFTIAIITPFASWSIKWLINARSSENSKFIFHPSQLRRSGVLSLTLLINTSAVNIPIILCVATQSPAYAADFGFLMKIFAAPTTLANAMFGQLFLADNIKRNISDPNQAAIVRKNMWKTTFKASGFVSLVSVITIVGVFGITILFPLLISIPSLSIAIAFAVIAQAAFSPVSAIGDIAKLENPFLIFYIARVAILYAVLSAALSYDFSVRFAIINLCVYSIFWLFADRQLAKLSKA